MNKLSVLNRKGGIKQKEKQDEVRVRFNGKREGDRVLQRFQ